MLKYFSKDFPGVPTSAPTNTYCRRKRFSMKFWKLMLVMVLVLATIVTLAACGGDGNDTGDGTNDNVSGGNKNCDHVYDSAITKKATCTETGVMTYTCSMCGASYTEDIPLGDHDYVEKAVKPTCTTPGIISFTCACGATKPDEEIEPAKGHDYIPVVTAPTCKDDGYTTYTCSECGDSYVGDTIVATGVHNLVTTVLELTAEQKAQAPKAIGVEAVACTNCDFKETTQNAVYVFMDFDTVPEDLAGYTGSEGYQGKTDADKAAPGRHEALVYIDSQENLDLLTRGYSHGVQMQDGKLLMDSIPCAILDTLKLGGGKSVLKKFTISFDITVNFDPAKSDKDYIYFYSMVDMSRPWDGHNPGIGFAKTGMNDDATGYEMIVNVHSWSATPSEVNQTGFYMILGKEYSIKLDFDVTSGRMLTVSIKEAGSSSEYQVLGSYATQANYGSDSYLQFGPQSHSKGNLIDNFKIIAAFGDEKIG